MGLVEQAGKDPKEVFQPVLTQPDEARSWEYQGKRLGGLGPGKEGRNHAGLPELDVSLLFSGLCPCCCQALKKQGSLRIPTPGGERAA